MVEWIANQDWCDGQVNMMGISYGGFTALQVAALAPPHLRSIIPVMFTDDRYLDECHYRGGLKRLYYNLSYYGGQMIAWNALPPILDDGTPQFAEIWKQHLDQNEPYLLKWYQHQTNSDYWRSGSVGYCPENIKCPVFMIGGWRDGYMNSNLRLYEKLTVPKKVLIGPWNHAMPDMAVPGPRIDYMKEVGRWLDYWCKDKDTGVMSESPVTVFMQESEPPDADRVDSRGRFRGESAWPVPQSEVIHFNLQQDSLSRAGKNSKAFKASMAAQLKYDPTVGICGGLFSGGLPFGLPTDQRLDEALSKNFTSTPVEEDFCILGRPRTILHVSTEVPVVAFSAVLSDVSPDGSSHLVTKGILNITRRNSFTDPEPAIPGEITRLEIELDATGWVFKKGHRIRLSIANADFPNMWPTPYPAVSTIYSGPEHTSQLLLPKVPNQGSGINPEFKPSALNKKPFKKAIEPPVWKVTRDMINGRTDVSITSKGGWRISPMTVFKRVSSGLFSVAPDDPAHASGTGRHVSRLVSPGMEIVSESNISIQASTTTFQIVISLLVTVNGTSIHHRRWIESVPRHLL